MQIDPTNKTVSLDIREPEFYNDPYPCYERLQSECPMFLWKKHGLWTFTRHEDVRPFSAIGGSVDKSAI